MNLDKLSIFFILTMIIYSTVVVESYKFLGILPTTFQSHFIFGSALMRGLAKKGHEVYVISPFKTKQPIKNYYDVLFSYEVSLGTDDGVNAEQGYQTLVHTHESMMAHAIFQSPNVQQLMKSNRKFDAVICEVFYSEALFGFSEHFRAPLIALSTFGNTPWNTDMIGSPSPSSYVPVSSLPFSDHMSLVERGKNLKEAISEKLVLSLQTLPLQAALYKKYFPHLKRDMYTVRKNAAAVLINTHVSLGYPRPYVPNQIPVGGMHIIRQRKPLPADIAKFISEAKYGVIYFSMGTNFVSRNILLQKTEEILKALTNLKQRVLWKLDDPDLKGRHNNILIRNWFPQEDILAHENVKLFITQGGLLSVFESIYHGKPFIGIPVIGDQFSNMGKTNREGMSIVLNHVTLNAEDIISAVTHVINNKSFTLRAKEMSARYRDQPILPLDLAIYWVEHVARQKGAKYLHCAGLDLNFFQYYNIDAIIVLYGLLLTALLLIFYTFYRLIHAVWMKLLPWKTPKTIIKKKRN